MQDDVIYYAAIGKVFFDEYICKEFTNSEDALAFVDRMKEQHKDLTVCIYTKENGNKNILVQY